MTDLDKLEALAKDVGELYAEDREWPIVTIAGKRWHVENVAKQSSEAILDLIASARRDAEEIERLKQRELRLELALEPFSRAAIEAERQTGTNETAGQIALCRAARGETAWADYVRARAAHTGEGADA